MSSRQENILWLEKAIFEAGQQSPIREVPFTFAVKLALKTGVQPKTAEEYVKLISSQGPFKTNGYAFLIPSTLNGSSIIKTEPGALERIDDKLSELIDVNKRILSAIENS